MPKKASMIHDRRKEERLAVQVQHFQDNLKNTDAAQCNKITFSHVATSCRKGYTTAHIHCRHASKSASCQLHDDFYDDPITHMLIMHLLHLYDGNTGTCAAATKNHSAILSKTEEMETNRGKKMQPTNYDIRKEETLANRDAASTTSAYRILLHYASTIL